MLCTNFSARLFARIVCAMCQAVCKLVCKIVAGWQKWQNSGRSCNSADVEPIGERGQEYDESDSKSCDTQLVSRGLI